MNLKFRHTSIDMITDTHKEADIFLTIHNL